ncbi:MAG: translation elongation factor Ts [Algisphaera sp.]
MAITAKDVKDLRHSTGMGMMECKKALSEADGDAAKATELLREWAGGKMDTREAEAGEGALAVATSGSAIAMVKIMSETDFAARNEDFLAKAQSIADEALGMDTTGEITPNDAMNKAIEDLRVTIKEKIAFGGGSRLTGAKVANYVHTNNKSGAIIAVEGDFSDDLLRGLCMHITAAAPPMCPTPLALNEASLPEAAKAQALAQFVQEAKDTGKPAEIAEKIAGGKMNKWVSDHTLLGQIYIKEMDAKKPIQHYIPKGGTILAYERFAV